MFLFQSGFRRAKEGIIQVSALMSKTVGLDKTAIVAQSNKDQNMMVVERKYKDRTEKLIY